MNALFSEFEALRVAASSIVDASAELADEERDAVARVSEKRIREYTTGRRLAHQLLRSLGAAHPVVTQARDRSPRWPSGFVGSIAHTDRRCIVVVGRSCDFYSVGIDIEPAQPIEAELFDVIASRRELIAFAALTAGERGLAVRRLFTVKEAVYKCVHPLLKVFLDFHEIAVDMHDEGRSFSASIAGRSALEVRGSIVEREECFHVLATAPSHSVVTTA